MSHCASCRHNTVPSPEPATLVRIREGYRTRWNDLVFTAEMDSDHWTLRIQDSRLTETFYTARRSGLRAAQTAAAEYAIFRVLGTESRISPNRLAQELTWQPYW
jgi:hypothetical protein